MNTLKCILTNYTSFLFHANLLIHFNDLQCFEAFVRIPENSETNGNNDKNNVIIIVQYLILSEALFLSSQSFSDFVLVFTFIRLVYNTIFDFSLSQHEIFSIFKALVIYAIWIIYPPKNYHYHKVFIVLV